LCVWVSWCAHTKKWREWDTAFSWHSRSRLCLSACSTEILTRVASFAHLQGDLVHRNLHPIANNWTTGDASTIRSSNLRVRSHTSSIGRNVGDDWYPSVSSPYLNIGDALMWAAYLGCCLASWILASELSLACWASVWTRLISE